MDISSAKYIAEMEAMEELNLIHQCHMDSIGGFGTQNMGTPATSGLYFRSSATSNLSPKTNGLNSRTELCFQNASSRPYSVDHLDYCNYITPKDESVSSTNFQLPPLVNHKRPYTSSNPAYAQDHILAERKRREKLSQRFIALSAILPGLKKMDKASILGDGIKYLRHLKDRVKALEEQTKKRSVDSVVFVKKSQLLIDDDENDDKFSDKALPEIEARVSEKDVLIRIHCERKKGFLARIIEEIENLHMSIVNSSALPFGDCSLIDVTIIAKKDDDFDMTVKDLVNSLRVALLEFMRHNILKN